MNPLSRKRLLEALKEEQHWLDALTGEALDHANTVIAALKFLLEPEVTEGMYHAGIKALERN